jgi:hypothetical protein
MRTDYGAHPAAVAFGAVQLKRHHITEISHPKHIHPFKLNFS